MHVLRRAFAVVSISLAPIIAHGGRPLDTDDAAVLPRGACQVETFARRSGAVSETRPAEDYGFAPSCNPFGWGEILIGAGRAGVGGDALSGRQSIAQIKYVPVEVSGSHAGYGIDASYEQDYAKGRSHPAARVSSLVAIGSVALSDRWQADANFGWSHEGAPAAGDRDHRVWGIALEWAATRRLAAVGEVTGTSARTRAAQVGGTFAWTPRWTFDAAIGRRHVPNGHATFALIGLTVATEAPP